MNKIYLFIYALLAVGMTACYEDKGNYDYHPINEIRITNIDKEYVREKWQLLNISPDLGFTVENTDRVAYRWEIDGKLVSQEPVLSYNVAVDVADDPYKCRFTAISLADSAQYYQYFELKVVTPYEKGLLVLSEQQGKAMLSFRSDGAADKEFEKWTYKTENGEYMTGKPLSLEQPDWEYDNQIFVSTTLGSYRLDKNILKLIRLYNGNTMLVKEPDFAMKACVFTDMQDGNPWGCAIGANNKLYMFRDRNDYFSTPSPNPILLYDDSGETVEYELSSQFILVTAFYGSSAQVIGYDNRAGRYLYFRKKSAIDPEQFNRVTVQTPIVGMPLLAVGSWDYKKFASFFYDPQTNQAKVVATHNNLFSNVKPEALVTLDNHDFTPSTILKFCDATGRAIFSSGCVIRQISMSNATAPSTVLSDKLPANAQVTCLKLSPDRKRLYVGVLSDREEEFKGDLYVLDAMTGDIVETYTGVGGRLVDVIEKF